MKRSLSFVCIALALVASSAGSLQPELDRATIASMPTDAGLIVVVNKAAAQRKEPAGRASIRLLEDANLLSPPVREAWSQLAEKLRWDEMKAFDELLGHRFAIIGRFEPRVGARWTLLTLINDDTRDRLLKSVSVTPRRLVGGRVVSVGEGGGFQLAIGATKGGWSRLLLAAPESTALFDLSLPILAGEEATDNLGDDPAFARVDIDVGADAILILRGNEGSTITTFTAKAEGNAYTGKIGVSTDADRAAIGAWSQATFDRLDDDAIGVILGAIEPGAIKGISLPLADVALAAFADLYGERFGGRIACLIEAETGALRTGERHTLGVCIAAETNDVFRASHDADETMIDIIRHFEQQVDPDAGEREIPNYRGEMLESIRVEPLEGELARLLSGAFGPRPTVTWVGCPWGAPPGDHAPPPFLQARMGWWGLGIGAGGVDGRAAPWQIARICDVLGSEPPQDRQLHSAIGVVRPRRLVEWLTARAGAKPIGQIATLSWLDEIEWELTPGAPGLLTGAFRVGLHDAPTPPGR